MKEFHKLIKEICDENKIKCSILSKDWIVMLEKDNKTRFISGYKFDLNQHGIGNVFDDKFATYEILKNKNIPIIEHKIVFETSNKNDYAVNSNSYDIVTKYFNENNQNIVLKANDSTCGSNVFHITDIKEIPTTLDTLFQKSFSISLCPFYQIKTEYRLIILNNKCVLVYGKRKPIVIGDGKKTIRELLKEFNPYYFENKLNEEKYTKVLEKDEIYEYSWQFNLSKGAVCFPIEDVSLKQRLIEFSQKITDCIDLGFCSLDIIETNQNELFVMEINSGVMMKNYMNIIPSGRKTAKKIYKDAILAMFK